MALPTTGPITMTMVAAELGIPATGLSLNDPRVRNLAGKPTGPVSFADLRGKSAEPMPLPSGFSISADSRNQDGIGWNGFFIKEISGLSSNIGSITTNPEIAPGVFVLSFGEKMIDGQYQLTVHLTPGSSAYLAGRGIKLGGSSIVHPFASIQESSVSTEAACELSPYNELTSVYGYTADVTFAEAPPGSGGGGGDPGDPPPVDRG